MSYNFAEFNTSNLKDKPKQLELILDENKKRIDKLLETKNKTYSNFAIPFQELSHNLETFITPVFHIDSVDNSELTQEIYGQCLPLISNYSSDIAQNEELFEAFKSIDCTNLTPSSVMVIGFPVPVKT